MSVTVQQHDRRQRGRFLSELLWMLLPLLLWTGTYVQGEGTNVADTPLNPPGELHVAIREGRLSVHIEDGNVQEVLAQIGAQAGLPIFYNARSSQRISAHFTDVELDKGIRRILRLASLSHTIMYVQGPLGVAVKAIHVFGEEGDGASHPSSVADHTPDSPPNQPSDPPSALRQEAAEVNVTGHLTHALTSSPASPGQAEHEIMQRVLQVLGGN